MASPVIRGKKEEEEDVVERTSVKWKMLLNVDETAVVHF